MTKKKSEYTCPVVGCGAALSKASDLVCIDHKAMLDPAQPDPGAKIRLTGREVVRYAKTIYVTRAELTEIRKALGQKSRDADAALENWFDKPSDINDGEGDRGDRSRFRGRRRQAVGATDQGVD